MSEQPHDDDPAAQAPDPQDPPAPTDAPVAGGDDDGPPAQGEGAQDSY